MREGGCASFCPMEGCPVMLTPSSQCGRTWAFQLPSFVGRSAVTTERRRLVGLKICPECCSTFMEKQVSRVKMRKPLRHIQIFGQQAVNLLDAG